MLDSLSPNQVELALEWLASPLLESPPEELLNLTQVEWFLLDRMLDQLMVERGHSPVH
jgi:hypothetical protein